MSSSRKVVLTGGGTAGHVTPNLALLPALRERGWEVEYVGSRDGIEQRLASEAGLSFHAVHTGKLRRYLSWQNFVDPLRILWGIVEATLLLRKLAPNAVFSKGGFVGVPVVVGAWLNRIPVVIHESDLTPGLANRISFPFARHVCLSFRETPSSGFEGKQVYTGTPVRRSLLAGERARALRTFELDAARQTVLVFGGSQGARAINELLREALPLLTPDLQVLHVCGPGNLDAQLERSAHYRQFEYLDEAFADAFACADVAVSRAGANSLAELIALRQPAVVIPLPTAASRGDQIDNARLFAEKGYGLVAVQSELTASGLNDRIREVLARAGEFSQAMARAESHDPAARILDLLEQVTH